jgi:hypothetical protein
VIWAGVVARAFMQLAGIPSTVERFSSSASWKIEESSSRFHCVLRTVHCSAAVLKRKHPKQILRDRVTKFARRSGSRISREVLGHLIFAHVALLRAQNPDELLVVRLPATQGYINRHATPLSFPTGRSQTDTPGSYRRCVHGVASSSSRMARADDSRYRSQAVADRHCHQEVAPLRRGKNPRNLLLR